MASIIRAQSLFSQASENDWIILQDMTEKAAGNYDNSQLVLSLDTVTGQNDDVYVVHYDLSEIGTTRCHLPSRRTLINKSRVQAGEA